MKRLLKFGKWAGLGLLAIGILAGLAYAFISLSIEKRMNKQYTFEQETLTGQADKATLVRGEHLATIKGCFECHGTDLSGKVMADDPALGRLVATNLTTGKGGLPADYTAADWMMALRHGVDRRGRPLLFMPSHETTLLAEPDLSALITYCRQVQPVDRKLPETTVGPLVKTLAYFEKMPLLSVEKIDHTRRPEAQLDTTMGVKLGEYLAVSCSGCHQPDFKGGDPLAPGQPPVPDLTRSGQVGKWTQTQFMTTLRTGKTPAGHQLDNEQMPWKMTAHYSDKEIRSLYLYFRSIQ